VVLNVQNHFLHVLRESSAPVGQLLRGVGLLAESARAAGIPVLYTLKTAEREPDGRETSFGHPRLPGGEDSRDVVDAIRPQVGDSVLVAKRFSAFAGTRLRRRLAELGRLLTAADAWMQDMEPFVVADAVADRAHEDHRMAVDWIAATCGAVRTVRGVADVFGEQVSQRR
jgi:bifunctional isochorismate lyase/aryl carrier protein